VDDRILETLDKGHTHADFLEAVAACRAARLTLVPTFVAFTPWTTLHGYRELVEAIEDLELVPNVPSIQWAIRLLIPDGSRLLERDDIRTIIEPFDREALVYRWRHRDPRVDALQRAIEARVAGTPHGDRERVFREVRALARLAAAGDPIDAAPFARVSDASPGVSAIIRDVPAIVRAAVPYLDEPWYC